MENDDTASVADSSLSNDVSEVSLNKTYSDDRESVSLLRQIFPDEPISALRRLHHHRVERLRQEQKLKKKTSLQVELPDNFLRLPADIAVLRPVQQDEGNDSVTSYRYESLQKMENKAMEHAQIDRETTKALTRAVFRDAVIGLGMTLEYDQGFVKVYSVNKKEDTGSGQQAGPSERAGIQSGDIIVGFNGQPLSNGSQVDGGGNDLLLRAVETIRNSPNPVVIHCMRPKDEEPLSGFAGASLLDETQLDSSTDSVEEQQKQPRWHGHIWSTPSFGHNGEPRIHPLVRLLSSRNLVPSRDEEMALSAALAQFTERAWEIETSSSLKVNQRRGAHCDTALLPLVGVRKALSVRILNSFKTSEGRTNATTAFTIWVYDVESGREWYAPLRYLEDFVDLRYVLVKLIPAIQNLPFPSQLTAASLFGSPRSTPPATLETQSWQLEKFLRSLCSLLYESQLHASIGEVAVHVQSFLGCENVQFDVTTSDSSSEIDCMKDLLKRSIQCYVYRVFLLRPLTFIVDDFVENMRQKCPSLQQLESLEAQGAAKLQERALGNDYALATLEKFLDFLQSVLLEGCTRDFRSITLHDTFTSLRENKAFRGKKGEIAWTALVRDAVREQVEVEAYVPLRSVVSKWLVNGWRHDDMEAHHKIHELRKRPISFFVDVQPPTRATSIGSAALTANAWMSAAAILKENVERSTLPCAKLRAIVDAAREIARICSASETNQSHHPTSQLGADQFLPILIYCVVMANLERPCALCVLLRALCDKVNKIGEVGYYLASFEAAVVHVREFNSFKDQEVTNNDDAAMQSSFVSVNINF